MGSVKANMEKVEKSFHKNFDITYLNFSFYKNVNFRNLQNIILIQLGNKRKTLVLINSLDNISNKLFLHLVSHLPRPSSSLRLLALDDAELASWSVSGLPRVSS